MINKISTMLVSIADRLEAKGLIKEAYEIDKIGIYEEFRTVSPKQALSITSTLISSLYDMINQNNYSGLVSRFMEFNEKINKLPDKPDPLQIYCPNFVKVFNLQDIKRAESIWDGASLRNRDLNEQESAAIQRIIGKIMKALQKDRDRMRANVNKREDTHRKIENHPY